MQDGVENFLAAEQQAQHTQRKAKAHHAQKEANSKTAPAQKERRGSAAPSSNHFVRRLEQALGEN